MYCPVHADMTHTHTHTYRVVTYEMGKKLASEWNVQFVESSSKQKEVRPTARDNTLLVIRLCCYCPKCYHGNRILHQCAPPHPQKVYVIFQRILSELERQFGTQDDGGCTLP